MATSTGSPTRSREPSPAPCAERTDPFAIVAAMALLSGQVAIVTGAGRGLGRAVSETLAALGASVVLASRNAPELDEVVKGIKRSGGHALAQTADVAAERQVQDLALATARWVGPAKILGNCARLVDPMAPPARSDPPLSLRNIALNAHGTYL